MLEENQKRFLVSPEEKSFSEKNQPLELRPWSMYFALLLAIFTLIVFILFLVLFEGFLFGILSLFLVPLNIFFIYRSFVYLSQIRARDHDLLIVTQEWFQRFSVIYFLHLALIIGLSAFFILPMAIFSYTVIYLLHRHFIKQLRPTSDIAPATATITDSSSSEHDSVLPKE